ncbi:hypothetical protein K432DRAFT_415057 [Lepidopterella palustris CBS 459.81]|uniref:Fumarylacetoacetase-like C-terminal domain-containing protein n=1 Tax=Lepidopterella palustris CBS 459.81 TaxID=1314670 RepID=A0A8E2JHN4_9PEZI|nr:hypothetical protein K432DRAFT_415057 [Lepidopterella palustris CBS 459.81]
MRRPWQRLVRFIAKNPSTGSSNQYYYGDAILPDGVSDIGRATHAHILSSVSHLFTNDYNISERVEEIGTFLAPLNPRCVPNIRCLGLNYARHAREAGMSLPARPIVFYKPRGALHGRPFDPIRIPLVAQETPGLDYECELVAVIGRMCKDVTEADALEYVAGYCVGNDISHRELQLQRGGGQWAMGKGFDGWAPIGPGIVSSEIIGDPQNLNIMTKVNGEVMQESNTRDMVFSVAKTIEYLSQGTTLFPGDLIFTGTPEGVGMGRKPPLWLKDGDVVEVNLEGVGSCVNQIKFERNDAPGPLEQERKKPNAEFEQ